MKHLTWAGIRLGARRVVGRSGEVATTSTSPHYFDVAVAPHSSSAVPHSDTKNSSASCLTLRQDLLPWTAYVEMPARTTSRSQDEKTVRDWGFNHVFTWTDGP